MKSFGLIGKKLTHSFSKKYFEDKFKKENLENHNYELFELETIDAFKGLISDNPLINGLNVTIPYKQLIIPFLDDLDESAAKVGAVNTIKVEYNNNKSKLIGYNTDFLGFKNSLVHWIDRQELKALVLGTGGAAKAVCTALEELSIRFKQVSRNEAKGITYRHLMDNPNYIEDHELIINTTPVGMYPNVDSLPLLPYNLINESHFLYDLVYNPELTSFLKQGQLKGAKIKNGLEMLHLQAEYSWEIWKR